jgi:glycine cleavage system H lipoate-binding protein
MSVLVALLVLALMLALGRLFKGVRPSVVVSPESPRRDRLPMEAPLGTDIPKEYRFHPCHTWALDEGTGLVRVGMDSFAAKMFDKIEHIDIPALQCWVRQGQNLMTVTGDGVSVDFPSPVEGPLTEINRIAIETPELVAADPYRDGWIAVIKSPCFAIDKKNLMQGAMVVPWMRHSMVLLQQISSHSPALAQDGGIPVTGVLKRVTPEVRNRLLREFFLMSPVVAASPRNRRV